MTISVIDTGSSEYSGDGESIRSAFTKINANFSFVNSLRNQVAVPSAKVGQEGDISGTYAVDNDYIYFCVADYDGAQPIWVRVSIDSGW